MVLKKVITWESISLNSCNGLDRRKALLYDIVNIRPLSPVIDMVLKKGK